MKEYPKIQTVFKRNPNDNFKSLLIGKYSLPEFEYLKNNEWIFTEKIDGTNIRVIWQSKEISFKGKTDNAEIPKFLLEKLNQIFMPLKDIFNNISPGDMCLYGEGYGARIQKGGENYIKNDVGFILFDVKIEFWWLERKDIEDIAKKLNIQTVPIIGNGTLDDMINITQKGFNSVFGDFIAEGIVARSKTELCTRAGQRIITKIKHKDFTNKLEELKCLK